jgi:hypothetical protein
VNPYASQIELEAKHVENIKRFLNTQKFSL